MHKEQSFRKTSKRWIDVSIQAAYSLAGRRPGVREAYERLLEQVRLRTTLLRPRRDPRRLGWNPINPGLYSLAMHHTDWLRPPEAWRPPRANARPQFASLAAHLLALYALPAFMASAWFQVPPDEPHIEQEWYKHLGRGNSIRTARLPLAFTRAMAHPSQLAPDHYTVSAALRWAQVMGLGGSAELARAVVATRLGSRFGNEDFWVAVLRFFVRHPGMDTTHVGPVVDFLQHQRFETREVFVPGQGPTSQGPPQPHYSVKGRTVASLLRQLEAWHRQLGRDHTRPGLAWGRSSVGEFRHVEGTEYQENLRCWTVRELLTSRELFLEGQALRHCVAAYAADCARRRTTIWSMQVDSGRGPHRALTVEVDPGKKRICQARGKANRRPRPAERAVLERWAASEGLLIADPL
jgi:hypothetical protein